MSIWSSWEAPDDDTHDDNCARWDKSTPGIWEISVAPCDCGQLDAPLVYQGSNVLPSEDDERGGFVDIASLSCFVRYYRDNPDAHSTKEPDGIEPFVRFGVGGADGQGTVVLTRRNVERIHSTLTDWLRETSTTSAVALSQEVGPS